MRSAWFVVDDDKRFFRVQTWNGRGVACNCAAAGVDDYWVPLYKGDRCRHTQAVLFEIDEHMERIYG